MRAITLLTCSTLLLAALSTAAQAQDALGGGNALDANPRRGSGGVNAPGGAGRFNRLGAAAPRTFGRSFDLNTDAAFRTHNIQNVGGQLLGESLYNNPWYWQNVGSLYTELITGGSGSAGDLAGQQQGYYNPFFYDQWETPRGRMQMAAGTSMVGLTSPLDHSPPQPAPGAEGNVLQVPTGGSTLLQDDRLGSMMRAGRDHWRRDAASRIAGRGLAADKTPMRYTLSYMRGIGRVGGGLSPQDVGLDDWDTTRLSADMVAARPIDPVGRAWQTKFTALAMPAGRMDPDRLNGSRPGLMQPVMQAVADRYGTLRTVHGSAEQALAALDRQYGRIKGAVIRGGDEPLDELLAHLDELAEEQAAVSGPTSDTSAEDGGTDVAQGVEDGTSVAPLSADEFSLILQHGQQIASLSSGNRSRFDDLVAAGELALRDGEYLRADRRFTRALRFIPGEPLATAGLINAQVGAGLYLSASLTLKSLLGFQPEMIDVRFAEGLLPQETELNRAISVITQRLQADADLDRYGLILAWIGHQLQRPRLVEEGLHAMDRSGRDPAFTALLRSVWQYVDPVDDAGERIKLTPTP